MGRKGGSLTNSWNGWFHLFFDVCQCKCMRKILRISYLEHKTNDWEWSKINFFVGPQELSRDGNSHGSDMSHATAASPKPSFRAPWRLGDAVVGRGNVGRTTSKSGHPCPCQNLQGPPAKKTRRESLPHAHLPIPSPTTQSGKGLN